MPTQANGLAPTKPAQPISAPQSIAKPIINGAKQTPFVHLHCHTDHSFLDGVGRSAEYVSLAAKYDQPAIAITDHGNLHGLPAHKKACDAKGLKNIPGCEMYVNDERASKETVAGKEKQEALAQGTLDPTFTDAHLVLLAADQQGWRNLLKLNHDAVNNGFYYRPRTTHDLICQNATGLFATTACLGSQFSQYALMGNLPKLRALLSKFKDAFGDRFYHEIHLNELPEQHKVNQVLTAECDALSIPHVFACDVHYACGDDCNRQDEMVAVARNITVNDPTGFKITARHLFFAAPHEAYAFGHARGIAPPKATWDQAIRNTVLIADRCTANIYDDSTLKPPNYIDDKGAIVTNGFELLRQLAAVGFKQRFKLIPPGPLREKLKARLLHELTVIAKCDMANFYLVTMDITDYCHRQGIFVWTRGSGCASLVAYCINITSIDPIRFDLLFERFVDPSRPNAPDFDLDIDARRRHEVIEWFTLKYGGVDGANIARIVALQTFGLKSAIRDVCKTREVNSTLAWSASRAVDDLPPSVEESLASCSTDDREALFDEAIGHLLDHGDDKVKQLIDAHPDVLKAAFTMVGRVRGRGQHAAGFVVAPGPLIEHVPIDRVEKSIVTAWGEGQASQDIGGTGLMKVDMLSLDTCAVISEVIKVASKRHGTDVLAEIEHEIDSCRSDFADEPTRAEYAKNIGFGLHQLAEASQRLSSFVTRLELRGIDELVAAIALYRPGSIAFLEDFIKRARGLAPVPKVNPIFDAITAETYGILVYQEQIMRVLNEIGGMPLRDAYSIIKAISKKKRADIEKAREAFIAHAQTIGIDINDASGTFDIIERFASYGFNKAHSASYAALSWITAYLRAHYPLEFWAAWLNTTPNEAGKPGADRKIELLMRATGSFGIKLHPPRIGYSSHRWIITKGGGLLAPLSIVLGVGEESARQLCATFNDPSGKPWTDFWSCLRYLREHKSLVNTKALDAIAAAGAFTHFGLPPEEACDILDTLRRLTDAKALPKGTHPVDALHDYVDAHPNDTFLTPVDSEVRMALERKAIGFAFWCNPWKIEGREAKVLDLIAGKRIAADEDTRIHGKRRAFYMASIREHKDRKQRTMAFLNLQTVTGRKVKGVAFASTWEKIRGSVKADRVYLILGEYEGDDYIVAGVQGNTSPFRDIDSVNEGIPQTK